MIDLTASAAYKILPVLILNGDVSLSAKTTPKRKKRPSRLFRHLFIWLGVLFLFGGALLVGAGIGAWFWISQDLPLIERLADYRPPAVTQVLAKGGQLMAEYFHQRRYVIPLSEVPKPVVMAFVAAEDGDFFKHGGVDPLGILRAAVVNFRAGRVVQGGSTITQQVARGLLLSPQRTMIRKIKEAILAYRMESYLSKEEILYLYLNQIYLGHGAYGVQAAAQTYFGKNARDLDLAEGALLAGLVKAPSRYSPLRYPRRARTRQVYVIERLLADGHITSQQAQTALNRQMDIRQHSPITIRADYYTEYVRQWLEEHFGAANLYEGGLTVYTACDPEMTRAGQEAIHQGIAQLTRRQGYKGPLGQVSPAELKEIKQKPLGSSGLEAGQVMSAVVTDLHAATEDSVLRMGGSRGRITKADQEWIRRSGRGLKVGQLLKVRLKGFDEKSQIWTVEVAQDPQAQAGLLALDTETGRVRVMIGGLDFQKSQFNRAVQARRQPGSAFKPFIYAAALDHPVQGWTPASVIVDAPVVYEDPSLPGEKWKPKNYENKFFGPTTLRTALEHSRNVVTVKILAQLGVPYATEYARRFGLEGELTPTLSLALGSSSLSLLEMTRAYSVFANGGRLVDPVVVERVLDRNGKLIYQAKPQNSQAISPQTAFVMTHLLRGVVENGTGRMMKVLKRPVAGKTGTTNDLVDAWFIGFTPQLICGVWVGQDDNHPLGRRETGARAAGPIWLEFMSQALKGQPAEDFPVPTGVVFTRVNADTGQAIPPGQAGGFFEAFKAGTEPPASGTATTVAGPSKTEDFLQAESFAPPSQGQTTPLPHNPN